MNQVGRWQHERGFSDPEQYLARALKLAGSEVKIFSIFSRTGTCVGSAFVGMTEGYDREKTQAMVAYGGGDASVLDPRALWINYESWEDLPGGATAFTPEELLQVWECFTVACRRVFPAASQVMVRSRHDEVWRYVYPCPPWRIAAVADLRGFEWTAPDGKVFRNYDERFARYGILYLPLCEATR